MSYHRPRDLVVTPLPAWLRNLSSSEKSTSLTYNSVEAISSRCTGDFSSRLWPSCPA